MSAQTTEPAVSPATEDVPNGLLSQAGSLDLAQGEDAAAEPIVSLRPTAAPAEDGAVWPRGPVPGGLQALWTAWQQTDAEVIALAEQNRLPPEPDYAEWLVLLGKGELL